MAESRLRRVSIGFEGGQVLSVRLSEEVTGRLRRALENGGWHDLDVDDGSALIDLGKVVFVRTDAGETRVGFGV